MSTHLQEETYPLSGTARELSRYPHGTGYIPWLSMRYITDYKGFAPPLVFILLPQEY